MKLCIPCVCVVFISPEAATTRPWRKVFAETYFKSNLILLAVDEAHCITEWLVLENVVTISENNHRIYRRKDFRESFSILGDLRPLTKAPVLV